MGKATLESINRMLSACSRFLRVRTREEALRIAALREVTDKVKLEKELDAERELTKARAANDQLRKAIEMVRAERGVVTGKPKKDVSPKRTM